MGNNDDRKLKRVNKSNPKVISRRNDIENTESSDHTRASRASRRRIRRKKFEFGENIKTRTKEGSERRKEDPGTGTTSANIIENLASVKLRGNLEGDNRSTVSVKTAICF